MAKDPISRNFTGAPPHPSTKPRTSRENNTRGSYAPHDPLTGSHGYRIPPQQERRDDGVREPHLPREEGSRVRHREGEARQGDREGLRRVRSGSAARFGSGGDPGRCPVRPRAHPPVPPPPEEGHRAQDEDVGGGAGQGRGEGVRRGGGQEARGAGEVRAGKQGRVCQLQRIRGDVHRDGHVRRAHRLLRRRRRDAG